MAGYQIVQFDGVTLPLYNPEQDLSPGTVESTLAASVGGVFDWWGDRQRLPRRVQIPVSGIYEGSDQTLVDESAIPIVTQTAEEIVTALTYGPIREQLEALKSKLGVRGRLVRVRWDDTSFEEWITARLLSVRHRVKMENRLRIAEVECLFESAMVAWRAPTLETTTLVCTPGTNTMEVEVDGNVTVEDAVFTFTPSTANASVRVRNDEMGVDWEFVRTMPVGSILEVDAGGQAVTLTGEDAYSGFDILGGHTADSWLPLAVGLNRLLISCTGAGTATLEHYDQWL
jgi:hypothetical protein